MIEDNKNNKFEVFFAGGEEAGEDLTPFQILIWPSNYSWNDFQHKAHCKYRIINSHEEELKGEILVGLLDFKSEKRYGGEGLGNFMSENSIHPSDRLTIKEIGRFFTLLPNMQEYRNIIKFLGVEVGNGLLACLNDLVYEQSTPDSNTADWSKSLAINSKVFKLSFMRNSEPFFAYHNAEGILKGLNLEDINSISKELDLNFKLDGFGNKHSLNFRFSSDGLLPKRINVLIGKNGLGKSQTLNQIVRAALQQRDYKDNLLDPSSEDGRPMFSRLLAIATPGETSTTYPTDNISKPKLDYRRLVLTRNGSKGIGKNLLQLARLDESINTLERWDLFIGAISKCIDISALYISKKSADRTLKNQNANNKEYVAIDELRSGWTESVRLENWAEIEAAAEPKLKFGEFYQPLSSGQLAFFKFALLACLNIENGSMILIDEPETHLHPNLISDFVELLDDILEQTGSYAIIATHSAYFVREIPSEQVHVYKTASDGHLSITTPRLKTFGSDVGDISHFVFDEDIESGLYAKLIRKAKASSYSFSDLKQEYKNELSNETLMQIRRTLKEEVM
jgi:energy-coupling factor transporter ATP-binding protein EcfA2